MSPESTSTAVVSFEDGALDPAMQRQLSAHWQRAAHLVRTITIPDPIKGRREKRNGQWVTIPNDPEVVLATVFAVVQVGHFLGYPPELALARVDVIKGRIEPRYDTLLGAVQKAGHQVRYGECNAETATIKIRRAEDRNDADPDAWGSVTFTIEDARRMGLAPKAGANLSDSQKDSPWIKDPETMLISKAAKRAVRRFCSDALTRHALPGSLADDGGATVAELVAPARAAGVIDAAATISSPAPTANQRAEEVRPSAPQDGAGDDQHTGDDDVVDAEIVDDEAPHGAHDNAGDGMRTPDPTVESTAEVPGGDAAPADPPGQPAITDPQRRKLMALLSEKRNATTRPERIDTLSELVGRRVESTNDLTVAEASRVIDHLWDEDPWGEP